MASVSEQAAHGAASTSTLSTEQLELNLALLVTCQSPDHPRALQSVKELIERGADAWYEDSELGWSSLHYAAESDNAELCSYLLSHGAIWNAVDHLGFAAAEVAFSLNHDACYRIIFEEGVRQTVILNLLGRQAEDEDEAADADAEDEQPQADAEADHPGGTAVAIASDEGGCAHMVLQPEHADLANDNDKFLKSKLRFIPSADDPEVVERCLDEDGNMVMAAWETDIMERTTRLLCEGQPEGFSILNVGFGLGIVDRLFQTYKPGRHVIVEAHPDALALMRSQGWDKKPGVEIFGCKWEDAINDVQLGSFDAVFWDTFSQDYAEQRVFFDELPNLLSGPQARFSFFHGLAGTNAFFYDVLTRVAEIDLRDIGLETTWFELQPQLKEEVWEGVKRKYWSLDTYRLPLSTMAL
ncbi:S-adenosyl-L-methionine-dependent methyltransferase [Tilletiaria anomala UBC 951]|uniref:S-adenosyl-L-methionine-dependent methyltransferase n=1 Tax=Tilletiaria anomala (strain ATCC 24038 / CBS 436.72 / UBC 951) TaxID=1037660 RepID=A0A066W263_TILAU|nr:S-adenosyl-L-methionine-dependent methyltransferase [Tilletiaria anomala UBC 951]KDN46653.1 S-adenosyl-L-methionine-dependent methyltransferase [Tilletiaria anomala UBC 951]